MKEQIAQQCRDAVAELYEVAHLKAGDILVVGCSTSEVLGSKIGTNSAPETAVEIFNSLYGFLKEKGVYLAAQCCEHLNRAIVVERAALPPWAETVNAVPQPHAGGSFATAAYAHMADPVLVENIRAGAGIDIGGTLIGMHLRPVAVPVRLSLARIGEAGILCARTRPKYIGGSRAVYQTDELEVPR